MTSRSKLNAILAMVFLTSCGDDGGNAENGPSGMDQVVATYDDLAVCSARREGLLVYVRDEKTAYVCENGFWTPDVDGGRPDKVHSSIAQLSSGSEACLDGEIRLDAATDVIYKCDELQERWIVADQRDTSLQLDGCTKKRDAEIGRGADGGQYVCDHGIWREETESEKSAGRGCAKDNLGEEIKIHGYLVCSQSGLWRATTYTVAGTMTDPRDGGTVYRTIGIGSQMWMAENLNYEYKVDGAAYGNKCYDDSVKYCAQYGRLYSWAAAMDTAATGCGYGKTCQVSGHVRGVCPEGWHLPSRVEWATLVDAVGGESIAGKALKSTEGWIQSGNGDDAYGFSVLPAGMVFSAGFSSEKGGGAIFWSSSEHNQEEAHYLIITHGFNVAGMTSYGKNYGCSIRCIKD